MPWRQDEELADFLLVPILEEERVVPEGCARPFFSELSSSSFAHLGIYKNARNDIKPILPCLYNMHYLAILHQSCLCFGTFLSCALQGVTWRGEMIGRSWGMKTHLVEVSVKSCDLEKPLALCSIGYTKEDPNE